MSKRSLSKKFFGTAALWTVGLVCLAAGYHTLVSRPTGVPENFWTAAHLLLAWTGTLLPFASFAGGLAVSTVMNSRSLILRAALLSGISFGLLAYGSPGAEFQAQASAGVGPSLSSKYPFGPNTPGNLWRIRSEVLANPPASYRFWVDRPFDLPPNWLTFLIHSLTVIAGFAVLAALLGHQVGFSTSGLSPPARKNARWALGFLTAAGFFFAESAGREWVRSDPANSGLMGAWLPIIVPLLELLILGALARRLRARAYDPAPLGQK